MPEMPQFHIPAVRPPGTVELRIGDDWRARWVTEGPLPEGAPVTHVWAALYAADKGYAVRPDADTPWGMLEIEGTNIVDPEQEVVRLATERHGIVPAVTRLIGYYSCRATAQNPDYPLGAESVRALFVVAARSASEVPQGSGWERRRMITSEYGTALRQRYPDLELQLPQAAQLYMVMRAKGEV